MIDELGREGNIVYYTDGTGFDYPDGSGRAIQVWQQQPHRDPETYCLLSGWQCSPAYRRIGDPKKEVRPQGETWRGAITGTII
jgi:hypothetical protein